MGRLYSGNLSEYNDAVARLKEDHAVNVTTEHYRYEDRARMCRVYGETLRVVLQNGYVLTGKSFEESDEDVRCNNQTAWLLKVHSDLQHWK